MVTRRGGFLTQVDQFDPQYFGISPREATTMDPQQRLLLETATEALESAGLATDRLVGSATGVFVGITTSDYARLLGAGGPGSSDVYSATGGALNAAAGRISFTFGFQGPLRRCRHRVLIFAGRRASRLSEPAHWREPLGARRWRERHSVARRDGAVLQVGACWHPMAPARPSMPLRMGSYAPRVARSSR